jgi:hypothetical protein
MIQADTYQVYVTYDDIKLRFQRMVDYKRKNLDAMIRQYLVAEDMEISPDKLSDWRRAIHSERDELEFFVCMVEKLN